jgi:SurA-like protein/parvulin-like peptidyl-prolyl cis-trans isomerase-like protein
VLSMRKSLVVICAAAALLAGCGGGSSAKLGSADVAVVGSKHVPKSDFDALLAQAKRSFQQQGRKFPKQGTSDYETLKGQAVALLVQQAERQEKAAKMGIEISDKQVDTRLAQIKKQYFKGSEKTYKEQLAKQHLTDAQVREDVRAQLISEAVFNKVSKDVKISDKQVHDYYVAHKSLYQQPQTRDVRYILVGPKKPVAQSVFEQLKAGNDQTWCKLAKRYAKDSSGQDCGKATFSKGQTVPVFDKKAFSAPANKVVPPFYDPTQYKAWFVIEPLGPVKPKSVTPEKQVAGSIRQQLLQEQKNKAMTDWVSGLTKDFCSDSKIKYQVGYSPSPDPCAVTTTSATTTG